MRVWRLCRRAHGAFDGEGARRFGGRWSLRGTPVVYTSASAALATLEYFVHLDVEDAPPDLVLIAADVPGSLAIEEIRVGRLPREWRRTPAPEALARLGTQWVRRGRRRPGETPRPAGRAEDRRRRAHGRPRSDPPGREPARHQPERAAEHDACRGCRDDRRARRGRDVCVGPGRVDRVHYAEGRL